MPTPKGEILVNGFFGADYSEMTLNDWCLYIYINIYIHTHTYV